MQTPAGNWDRKLQAVKEINKPPSKWQAQAFQGIPIDLTHPQSNTFIVTKCSFQSEIDTDCKKKILAG